MTDSLSAFREVSTGETVGAARSGVKRALLLFEFDEALLGVPAESVDAVIAWRKPAPLPCATSGFAGVVQDRGRIVAVLDSPVAGSARGPRAARRLIVCVTPRGFVGLPADGTRGVAVVELAAAHSGDALVDSSEGPLVVVDPSALVESEREVP